MFIRYFYKIIKILALKILYAFSWFITIAKFKFNGVKFSYDFKAHGIPIISVNLKGFFSIGRNFSLNSGLYNNMIGRQQPCFFIVGKDASLIIGDNVGISCCAIVCHKRIEIEDNVKIGGGVVIYDTDFHSLNTFNRSSVPEITDDIKMESIKICKGAFIGAHSIILKGVVIGSGAIIGAGSVVTKTIPENEIWAGNPIKFIKKNCN